VRRETHQIQPLHERAALQLLKIAVVLTAHLLMQDLNTIEADLGRAVDASFDLDTIALEVPEGVRGNADSEWSHL
jgi:hypothetical protein